ncbi:MAG TPA: Maf family protein [Patescibacteria group bacterium]|nr:Maf family protein [Patescibacteria group bacterium]
MKKIILASKSPRRKQLLESIKLKFEVVVSDFNESLIKEKDPRKLVEEISKQKAKTVAGKYKDAMIIAADTTVVLDKKIIGKPTSIDNAREILQKLSGRGHKVITGFTILDAKTKKSVTKSVASRVYFKKLTKKEIEAYIKTGEPMDKAGAYGVQDKAGAFIEKIEGDFFNVVGLPIFSVCKTLLEFGINITSHWK